MCVCVCVCVCVCIFFFRALDSVPLVCVSVFMLVPYFFDHYNFLSYLDIGLVMPTTLLFFSQGCPGYSWSFVVPYKFQDCFSTSVKNAIRFPIFHSTTPSRSLSYHTQNLQGLQLPFPNRISKIYSLLQLQKIWGHSLAVGLGQST